MAVMLLTNGNKFFVIKMCSPVVVVVVAHFYRGIGKSISYALTLHISSLHVAKSGQHFMWLIDVRQIKKLKREMVR